MLFEYVLFSHIVCDSSTMTFVYPTSQRELLVVARGASTQAEFAKRLGVDRTCLSRYEREQLGAPTSVLNYCLRVIAELHGGDVGASAIQQALIHVRRATNALEQATQAETPRS